jgi:hypothetical protein
MNTSLSVCCERVGNSSGQSVQRDAGKEFDTMEIQISCKKIINVADVETSAKN